MESAAVLGDLRRAERPVVADGAGRVPVGDLDDESRGDAAVGGGALQTAQQVDAGTGMDDGVGDEFTEYDGRVVHEASVEGQGLRQLGQFGPVDERGPQETTGGRGRERVSGQRRARGHRHPGRPVRRVRGAEGALPLDRNGTHVSAPE